MQPTTRVLAMLELLQANREMTVGALAARLGVDERTVRRYALKLADLGVPVEARRGRYGGYHLLPGYKLPPLMLTDDEAVAVVLGLLLGSRVGASAATESALLKVRRVLPSALRERVAALQQTLGFTLNPREGATPDAAALLVLASAARDRHRVRMAYRSWKGEASDRDLDPYGLVFHSGRWYVSGFDRLRGELRTFRVDRIATVTPLPETFEDPGEFDAVAQVTRSLANVPYAHQVEVVLETTLDAAARRIPPTVGRLETVDGGVLLRTRAEHLDGMARMLAGLGFPFVIHRPDELRTAVRDLARELAVNCQRTR